MTEPTLETLTDEERAVVDAVQKSCMEAIITYLTNLADTMAANGMIAVTVTDLRAMADTIKARIEAQGKTLRMK